MKLSKNKIFYIFLIVYVLIWFFVQSLRNQPGIDAMEAIVWGELWDWGTNKHPPLSGWIIGGLYNLVGQHEQIAYFLGASCVALGLVFVYKLAKCFMSEEKAICSAMVMPVCFYYTYTLFLDSYNCNFVSLAIFPMVAYYYYKSIKENKVKDWLLFGITSGLGTINKYQIVFLFFALFIHFIIFERKQFKQKGLYIALFAGIAIITPHILWLFKHDFFSFSYMAIQAGSGEGHEVIPLFSFKRIYGPIKFLADQVLAVLPCIIAYLLLAWQAKNIQFKPEENNLSDKVFIGVLALGMILAQSMMGVLTGSHIHGIWGSIMVYFTGLALFYFFPIKLNEKSFSFFVKLSYVLMILWAIAVVIFALVQTKHNISYPHEKNIAYFHEKWAEKTNNAPLKYVGGRYTFVFQFRIFDKTHPHPILETFGYKNPWEDHDDIYNSGAIIFANEEEMLEKRTRETIIKLPENYKITPEIHEYEIKNKFGKAKKYSVYYTIIPPQKNDL